MHLLPKDNAGFVITSALIAQIRTALSEETAHYIAQLIDKEETVLERWKEEQQKRQAAEADTQTFRTLANRLGMRVSDLESQLRAASEIARQLRAIL